MSNITSLQIGDNILNTEPHKKIACDINVDTHTAIGEYEADMSNILPNDDYVYECYFNGLSNSGSGYVKYKSDIDTYYIPVCNITSENTFERYNLIMDVGKERKIYVRISDGDGLGSHRITLMGYRKLYKDTRVLNED